MKKTYLTVGLSGDLQALTRQVVQPHANVLAVDTVPQAREVLRSQSILGVSLMLSLEGARALLREQAHRTNILVVTDTNDFGQADAAIQDGAQDVVYA